MKRKTKAYCSCLKTIGNKPVYHYHFYYVIMQGIYCICSYIFMCVCQLVQVLAEIRGCLSYCVIRLLGYILPMLILRWEITPRVEGKAIKNINGGKTEEIIVYCGFGFFLLPQTGNINRNRDFHCSLYEAYISWSQTKGQPCMLVQPQVDLHRISFVSWFKACLHMIPLYSCPTKRQHRLAEFSPPCVRAEKVRDCSN